MLNFNQPSLVNLIGLNLTEQPIKTVDVLIRSGPIATIYTVVNT
jgi:hypothetical protein